MSLYRVLRNEWASKLLGVEYADVIADVYGHKATELPQVIAGSGLRLARARVSLERPTQLAELEEVFPQRVGLLYRMSAEVHPYPGYRPMGFEVVPVRPGYDVELSAKLAVRRYRSWLDDVEPPVKGAKALYRAWVENDAAGRTDETWVARDEGQAIGFVAFDVQPELRHAHVDLIVGERGVGGGLMVKMMQRLHEHGIERVGLVVREQSVPALHLYEKFGFQVDGVLVDLAGWFSGVVPPEDVEGFSEVDARLDAP